MAKQAIKGELPPRGAPEVKTVRRPLMYNRFYDKALILLVPLTWFVYYSWRPVYELRADMPAQFVDAPATASAVERAGEQRLAQTYWVLARTLSRARYPYGSELPGDPPPDFRLNDTGDAASAPPPAVSVGAGRTQKRPAPDRRTEASDSRVRYWRSLKRVWLAPYSWDTKREWSTTWFTGPFLSLYVNVHDYLSNRFRAI